MKHTFYSHGKLLLTGEYVVLDGAKALALPTRFGQSLEVFEGIQEGLLWRSFEEDGSGWFEVLLSQFDERGFHPSPSDDLTQRLQHILQQMCKLNPHFLKTQEALEVRATLGFPKDWGLGSSSTLINNLAQWAEVDAYALLESTFGGSGYDIAVAQAGRSILYQKQESKPVVAPVVLNWDFKDQLFFVHLNEKQDSREGILLYENATQDKANIIASVSELSRQLIDCSRLSDFCTLVEIHEDIISSLIGIPTIKSSRFSDYEGTIKSLGAWGGDFILATGDEIQQEYFRRKGYHTILSYGEMIP